jgi:hypothetical protein
VILSLAMNIILTGTLLHFYFWTKCKDPSILSYCKYTKVTSCLGILIVPLTAPVNELIEYHNIVCINLAPFALLPAILNPAALLQLQSRSRIFSIPRPALTCQRQALA